MELLRRSMSGGDRRTSRASSPPWSALPALVFALSATAQPNDAPGPQSAGQSELVTCSAHGKWFDDRGITFPAQWTNKNVDRPKCAPRGRWIDQAGYTWDLEENGNAITGTFHLLNEHCSVQDWPVTGSKRNRHRFTVVATNPHPDDPCVVFIQANMNIE
jgi:hypothetical protein